MKNKKLNPKFDDLANPNVSEIQNLQFAVHHAKQEVGCDITPYRFEDENQVYAFIMSDTTIGAVYLISVFDRVFVCENIVDIIGFVKQMIYRKFPLHQMQSVLEKIKKTGKKQAVNLFLQEYSSYEDAYSVAKDMMEENPLCYP